MPKKIAEKPFNNGTLTQSQYFGKIRQSLRNAFRWWIPMKLALDKASRPSKSKNKRLKKEYQCAHCKKWFKRTDVQVDHIQACGSLRSYEDIVPFLKRLTVEDPNAYQILCKKDHLIKTQKDKDGKDTNL